MSEPQHLLDLPRADLLAAAAAIRDAHHGTRITYSPKVFIPLTMLCRDRCGYCTFAKAPARIESPYLSPEQVLAIATAGRRAGCHEALFTLGEAPEERYPVAADWLADQRLRLDGRLPRRHVPARPRRDRTAPPRQRRRARRRRARRPPSGRAEPGHDGRVAPRRPRRAPGCPRQGPGPPPRDPRGRRRARRSRSRPGSSSASARTGPTASPPWRRSPPATGATATCRRSSSRTSCRSPGRRCTPRRPARPPTSSRRSPSPDSCCRPRSTSRHRRTCPRRPTSATSSPPASTTGAASRPSPPTT